MSVKQETIDFMQRLDNATDYAALVRALFGDCRVVNTEMWLRCPWDETTPADKFSIDQLTGKWKNHKTDEGGGMIVALKKMYGEAWRERWAQAVPNARDILFNGSSPQHSHDTPRDGGPSEKTERKTFGERWEWLRTRFDLKHMVPFVEAYGVPADFMLGKGVIAAAGGKILGDDPRLVFAGYDPITGNMVGHKYRWLSANEKHPKSKNAGGSTAGLIGFDPSSKLPILMVEGEKDWLVAAYEFDGVYNVVTNTNGAGTFRQEWATAFAGREVVLCYDADDSGRRGSRKAASILRSSARIVRIADLGTTDADVFVWLRGETKPSGGRIDARGREPLLAILSNATEFRVGNDGEVDAVIYANCCDPETEPGRIGELLFKLLADNGAVFFQMDEIEAYCSWRGRVYIVGIESPHWSLLIYKYTQVDAGSKEGYRIHKMLTTLALVHGKPVEPTSWFARRGHTLYLPLHGKEQNLLRITKDAIDIVPNGHADIVLIPNPHVKGFTYFPSERYDYDAGSTAWAKLFGSLNTTPMFRDMVSAAVMSLPFYGFCETHPLLRFQGNTGSGKSFAGKLITTFLSGEAENQGGDTMAALFRMAGTNILLCLDNLEKDNLERNPELRDLMLRSASGMMRTKSAASSERATIRQRVTCWILTTGKTPMGTGYEDLEERLVVFNMGGFEDDEFLGSDLLEWVLAQRDLLFNHWVRQIQRMLGAIEQGAQRNALRKLNRVHRPRLHEWYALLSVAMGGVGEAHARVVEWLTMGSEGERLSVYEGSPIVPLLLRVPAFLRDNYASSQYQEVRRVDSGTTYTVTVHGQTLHSMLAKIARGEGMYYGHKDPKTLSYALRSLARVSKENGLEINQSENPTIIPGTGKRGRTISLTIQKTAMLATAEQPREPGADEEERGPVSRHAENDRGNSGEIGWG